MIDIKNSTVPLTDYMFAKAGMAQIPLNGTFELTPFCNYSCKMCYVRKKPDEVKAAGKRLLTLEEWISIAEEACKRGMLILLLTGGEPTLYPDFWELYDRLTDMGLLISINTNGSQIDDVAVEHFRRKPPRRLNITLYGASDETYERLCGVKNVYTKVTEGIRKLKEAGIQIKLNCSLTPENAGDLEELVSFSERYNLTLDIVTYMFPPLRRDASMIAQNERFTPRESAEYRMKAYRLQHGEEAYRKYLKDILSGNVIPPGLDEECIDPVDGKMRCRAGKSTFWLTWDGKMTPCGMMPEPAIPLMEYGFEKSWKEILKLCSEMKLSGICGECKDMKLCHSCAAMAYTETGSFSEVPKYLCETVAAMKLKAKEEIQNL